MGAVAYISVQPHLIELCWFRIATVSTTAMILSGAVSIDDDDVAFTLLNPQLGVGIFLLIPPRSAWTLRSLSRRWGAVYPKSGRLPVGLVRTLGG
jgi:hypothetical protein